MHESPPHDSPPRRRSHTPISLPLPGTPSATLSTYTSRLLAPFAHAPPRVCTSFFLFGLLNNILYVILLTAALDLVGPSLPKATVLLFDVLPSFFTKLGAPYFIHHLPYRLRIPLLVALSFCGMQMVAASENLSVRMFGVALASVSSGLGELSFLGMASFYGEFAVPFWGSGTGMAGLAGAGLYTIATSGMGVGVATALCVFGFLPFVMLVAFFSILPHGPLRAGSKGSGYEPLIGTVEGAEAVPEDVERVGLLGPVSEEPAAHGWEGFKLRLHRTKKLFFPYMLPLLIVYISEYTINSAIAPNLLYELKDMPFSSYREAYPMYSTLYQLGVFISRSSTPFYRTSSLLLPSLLQTANLAFLTLHALYFFIPSIYLIFIIIFWEGLLGGLVYVNTFAEIMESKQGEEREFAMSAVTVGDSAGVCVAGMLSLWVEGAVCRWQVRGGRKWCTLT